MSTVESELEWERLGGKQQLRELRQLFPRRPRRVSGAEAKIRTFLLEHHQFKGGRCGSYEPASASAISQNAHVDRSTVFHFLNKYFGEGIVGGPIRYKSLCFVPAKLDEAIQRLAGERE